MKVKSLLLVVLMSIGLTACSQGTSNEDGGYQDTRADRILDRVNDRMKDKQKIEIEIKQDDGVKSYDDYNN